MSSTVSRKRRTTGSPQVSGPMSKTRRANGRANGRANTRATANGGAAANGGVTVTTDVPAPPTQTVMDDTQDSVEEVVGEVVDLTCEASDAAVVDLTSNDSVLLLDEGPQSYVVSSDEEEATPPDLVAAVTSSQPMDRSTPGTISCPVCLDSYSEIVDSGRLVVSTRCGHVFCSLCLRDALRSQHTCPTCRKKLGPKQYHPLYV